MRISDWSSDVCSSDLTRRRLDGRTPLCGIDVPSRIDVIWKPTAWSARSADSRPEPGPLTSTSSVRTPCSARSAEHTSELQSLMRNSYAVFCLKKKIPNTQKERTYAV